MPEQTRRTNARILENVFNVKHLRLDKVIETTEIIKRSGNILERNKFLYTIKIVCDNCMGMIQQS